MIDTDHYYCDYYRNLLNTTVGIVVNVSCTAQNSAFKNHPTVILRGENHLYGIVLVHIIYKTAQNTTAQNTGGRI